MEEQQSETRYADYLKPRNRHRLFLLIAIALGTNWVGNGIVSYYLSPILTSVGITSTAQQSELNLGLQLWNRETQLFFFDKLFDLLSGIEN